jgi:hypothetical protein
MIYKNKLQKDIAFLSGKIKKSEYFKEDVVDAERFQMNVLSRVANCIDYFLNQVESIKRDYFDPPLDGIQNGYMIRDRFSKNVSDEEKDKVRQMVYELFKDKIKLIDASISKIFKGKDGDASDDTESDDDESETEDGAE